MKLLALISFLALAKANIAKGPSIFEDGDKVYVKVMPAVTVNVFQRVTGSSQLKRQDEIVLNGNATEFSAIPDKEANSTGMEVNFKWDDVDFKGKKDKKMTLTSLSAKLTFTRKLKQYSLTGAEVTSASIDGTKLTKNQLEVCTHRHSNELCLPFFCVLNIEFLCEQAHSENGYVMSAAVGSSFCCSNFGMLRPTKATLKATEKFAVGLTFPKLRMQVFDVKQPLSPCTDCGLGIPIGFWMGLIVTLIFALVCYYGFSMLASITTNDRWDDPKGMPIQVPQHD